MGNFLFVVFSNTKWKSLFKNSAFSQFLKTTFSLPIPFHINFTFKLNFKVNLNHFSHLLPLPKNDQVE